MENVHSPDDRYVINGLLLEVLMNEIMGQYEDAKKAHKHTGSRSSTAKLKRLGSMIDRMDDVIDQGRL